MADFSREELSQKLRQYIKRSSKTQRQVADEVGIGQPSYVSHLASGRVNWVESEYFPKLAEALRLSSDEIKELRPEVVVVTTGPITAAESDFVNVVISMRFSGITRLMDPENLANVTVPVDLAKHVLGGLVMDRMYIRDIPEGFYALWSNRKAQAGELVVIEKGGAQYPAFLLEGGMVEVDAAIDPTTALRFKPDRVLGVVEEIRLLKLPRRSLS